MRWFVISISLLLSVAVNAQQYEMPAKLTNKPEKIIKHEAYTVSFNTSTLTPNYVAWCLTPDRVNGKTKRTDFFDGDPMIEQKYRVIHGDYSSSRFDRGHMCPAADNRQSYKAMTECFFMTNMCPQNHGLNTGAWNDLEIQCRSWARNYKKIYIVAGPIFDNGGQRKIGRRRGFRIAVPDRFFKVVLMVGKNSTKAIGFIYPNGNAQGEMRDYAVSVDAVEKAAKIDFFPLLEDKIENQVEAVCKPSAWGI